MHGMSEGGISGPPAEPLGGEEDGERLRPVITRRDFITGAGVGVAATAAVAAGGIAIATRPGQLAATPPSVVQTGPGAPAVAVAPPATGAAAQVAAKPSQSTAPLTAAQRRVTLDIDNVKHDLVVDVRDTLWETLTYDLGQASANLGCDRAQCGACAVLVDGRAVNGCTVLSWRLGRGQKITTVAGLARGPRPEDLHPVQKAFWQEGGFQCGICTRGFIISTVALLNANKSPTDQQITQALSGNICRCSEYPKIYDSVQTAAAELRGEKVTFKAPIPVIAAAAAPVASAAPVNAATVDFEFQKTLVDVDDILPIRDNLKQLDGVLDVSGGETRISIRYDRAKITEERLKQRLGELGHAVK